MEINYSKYREILHQKYYTHQMIPNLAKHQMPWKKNKNNKPISPYYRNSVCTWIWWICCYQHKTLIRYVFETINSLTEVIAINPDGVSLVHFHSLNLSRCRKLGMWILWSLFKRIFKIFAVILILIFDCCNVFFLYNVV